MYPEHKNIQIPATQFVYQSRDNIFNTAEPKYLFPFQWQMSAFVAWPVAATAKKHKSLYCGMGGRKGMAKPLRMMTKFLINYKTVDSSWVLWPLSSTLCTYDFLHGTSCSLDSHCRNIVLDKDQKLKVSSNSLAYFKKFFSLMNCFR